MLHSVLFYFTGRFISQMLSFPFSLYSTFVLEETFGCNKQTYKLFFKDLFLAHALPLLIGAPLLMIFLKIIDYFGKLTFVFYVMIFLIIVQILMIAVYPVLIQPLFN